MLKTRPEAALAAMLVAAGMLPLSTKANTTFTEGVKHRIYTLHTHLASHPLDLSPQISSTNKEYKTAAIRRQRYVLLMIPRLVRMACLAERAIRICRTLI